jgi:hypothetical protein
MRILRFPHKGVRDFLMILPLPAMLPVQVERSVAMPSVAEASESSFPRLYGPVAGVAPETLTMPFRAEAVGPKEYDYLLGLEQQALEYFLDNQGPSGLILDRQHNHGPRRSHGLCSTATTGMGLIALGLASAAPFRLLTPDAAIARIRTAVQAALERLPHDHGMLPHFVDSATVSVCGSDPVSTLDSSWLIVGALWAAAFLRDAELGQLAWQLYERVDWHYWTVPESGDPRSLLRHGKGSDGQLLACSWDRLNGETAFMYVLAAGAAEGREVPVTAWSALQPFYGSVAGHRFNNADLGLFVFQYSLDLLDLKRWRSPGSVDLGAEAKVATAANYHACRGAADRFTTYRHFWGLSAGDGPGQPPAADTYRCYAPLEKLDGTAHLTATLAAVAHGPGPILENLFQAEKHRALTARGRYGFSNLNLDHQWIGRDMVGIDAGAAVLALDNYLMNDRVRTIFHDLACVRRGLERLGFSRPDDGENPAPPSDLRQAS